MKHSLKINKTESGREGLLTLSGDMDLAHAQEMRELLLTTIQEVDTLRLVLNDVASVDLSFVQLLCAAHRECEKLEKTIILQSDTEGLLQELLQGVGYYKQIGCSDDEQKSCLLKEAG